MPISMPRFGSTFKLHMSTMNFDPDVPFSESHTIDDAKRKELADQVMTDFSAGFSKRGWPIHTSVSPDGKDLALTCLDEHDQRVSSNHFMKGYTLGKRIDGYGVFVMPVVTGSVPDMDTFTRMTQDENQQ